MELYNYKNKHIGGDIYIICSGKSCDFIDNSFLENKIKIGINQAFNKCNCEYYIKKEIVDMTFFELIDKESITFISNGRCGESSFSNVPIVEIVIKKTNNHNIVLYNNYHNIAFESEDILQIEDMLANNEDTLITSASTITSGIHLALYMGAKNIILVGHDCCDINGESNYTGYHTDKTLSYSHGNDINKAKQKYKNWLNQISDTTETIRKILKNKHNVNLLSINPFSSITSLIKNTIIL
jgi:hypothetical protein